MLWLRSPRAAREMIRGNASEEPVLVAPPSTSPTACRHNPLAIDAILSACLG